jgi:hypothetical protein
MKTGSYKDMSVAGLFVEMMEGGVDSRLGAKGVWTL